MTLDLTISCDTQNISSYWVHMSVIVTGVLDLLTVIYYSLGLVSLLQFISLSTLSSTSGSWIRLNMIVSMFPSLCIVLFQASFARGLDWYMGYQHKFMSINSVRRYSSTWCRREKSWSRHQNCKRIGWVHEVISLNLCLLSLWVYLSLAPQDVTAPELQEVSLYQVIII